MWEVGYWHSCALSENTKQSCILNKYAIIPLSCILSACAIIMHAKRMCHYHACQRMRHYHVYLNTRTLSLHVHISINTFPLMTNL